MVSGVRGISRSVKSGKLMRYTFFVFTLFLFSSALMFYGGFTPLQSVDAAITTTTLRPDGDGTYHNWTGTPADSYDDWNDVTADGDTSYFYVAHDDYNQSSTLQNTGATGAIQNVKVVVRARNTQSSNDKLRTMLVIGGERYLGHFAFQPTTSYVDYYGWYSKNPATGADWTWTAINDLEAGVVSEEIGGSWQGQIRVTQLYVNISTPKPTVYVDPSNTTNLSLVPEATSPLILSPDADGIMTDWSAYPSPAYESHPSAYAATVSETDGAYAYDNNLATYAYWDYETSRAGRHFTVLTFGTNTGTITSVDFKMKYEADAAALTGEYTIKYSTDGWSTEVTLVPATGAAHSVPVAGYDTWANKLPSQGGSWTWALVADIEFRVETATYDRNGGAQFREYEAWVSVNIGGTDYTVWDEYPSHDGDTSYAYAGAAYLYESSTLEDHTSETWTIAGVKVVIYAKSNILSDDKLTILAVIGGYTFGASPVIGPTNETYTEYIAEWAKNPYTATYWTWSDIDALEVGVAADFGDDYTWDSGLEMRVTQLYVEVSGPRFAVDIKVDDVADLWLYQFELTYNPHVLRGVWFDTSIGPVEVGAFLSSAGGTPSVNSGAGFNNTFGKLPITGGYLSEIPQTPPSPPPPDVWPDGSGLLTTIVFHVIGLGDSNLRLEEITGLMDPDGGWISRGRDYVADGYFRNVAWGDMPKVDFTITPVSTPEPLEGYNTTFTSTTTGGTTPYTYKWYLWKIRAVELFYPIITSTDTVTRNYTARGYWNVTLVVIDDNDVVGTKTGYVRIKAHDIFFTAVTTNATRGQYPAVLSADMGDIVEINATAINQGHYTETFDVSTFWSGFYKGEMHYGLIGTETSITLAPGASQNVTFNWDTEGRNMTHPNQFAVHANASAVTYEYDREMAAGKIADNQFIGPPHRIRFRDIAVTGIVTNATGQTITPGVRVNINVTVTNQGDFNQTSISVTAYYDNHAIDTEIIPVMSNQTFGGPTANHTTTITFLWDTTDVGNVTIKATATWTGWNTPDHAEEDYEPDDNTFINGWIKAGAGAVPEFPLGAALEIALAILIIYVWSRSRRKIKPAKSVGFPTR